MSLTNIAGLAIGQTSTNASLASLLGTIYTPDSKTYYMLVKTGAAITAAQNVCLKWKTAGQGTYIVDAVTGAAAVAGTVAGVAQTPAADVADATYLWVARQGPVTATTNGAVAAGAPLATHGTAGKLDDTTLTYDTCVAYAMDAIGSATTGTVRMTLPI
jgi:hypothetical protein